MKYKIGDILKNKNRGINIHGKYFNTEGVCGEHCEMEGER